MWNPRCKVKPDVWLLFSEVLYVFCVIAAFYSRMNPGDFFAAFGLLGAVFFGGVVIAMRLHGTKFHWLAIAWHVLFLTALSVVVYLIAGMASAAV